MAAAPKCDVLFETSPAQQGLEVEAFIEGEDIFLGQLAATKEAVTDRRVSGTTVANGKVTLTLYRSTHLKKDADNRDRRYRLRCAALGVDAKLLVPNADTANVADIIEAF